MSIINFMWCPNKGQEVFDGESEVIFFWEKEINQN